MNSAKRMIFPASLSTRISFAILVLNQALPYCPPIPISGQDTLYRPKKSLQV